MSRISSDRTHRKHGAAHRHPAGLAVPLLVAAALAACDAPGSAVRAGAEGHTRVDSAGVSIVESHGPAWGERAEWTVDATPAVEIGEVDGAEEYVLGYVPAATRLRDGRIVLADRDRSDGTVRIHGSDGSFERSAAPVGQGPHEVSRARWLTSTPGDSIFVWDDHGPRVLLLDPDGGGARSWTMRIERAPPADVPATMFARTAGAEVLGRFRDGAVLAPDLISVPVGFSGEPFRLDYRVRTYARDGEPATSPIRREGRLLAPERLLALPSQATAAIWGDGIAIAEPHRSAQIERLARDGTRELIARLSWMRLEMTPELAAAWREAERARLDALGVEDVGARLRDAVIPDRLPAFAQMRSDTEDHLWIEAYSVPGDAGSQSASSAEAGTVTWHVLDPEGVYLGPVQIPAALEVMEIGADYVLGVAEGDLGVPVVRLHALDRAAR